LSQLVYGAKHVRPQWPAEHVPRPPTELFSTHDVPQPPQACGELVRSTHRPDGEADVPASSLQSVSGGLHDETHPEGEQRPVGAAH